jgi:hypothetical protein
MNLGLLFSAPLPPESVVDCKSVGSGKKALLVLGRYLFRSILHEANIFSDQDSKNSMITFRACNITAEMMLQSQPRVDLLWLLQRHVLPKRFCRERYAGPPAGQLCGHRHPFNHQSRQFLLGDLPAGLPPLDAQSAIGQISPLNPSSAF